ncbi:MAG: glycosyltransferase family 2 protein [Candidatus Eremiobacteraeota bacterium]|nr:glycosyltransferase family 2 protein [Candidatus Eremiobacteraeota bacterium]
MIEATVQLCTYNRAALLERVLEACFDQVLEAERYEVVLVNDGSTDSTASTIERARANAPCLFTVVHQANGGLAKARNAGIAHANGRRIIFIDDDVLPLPNFVGEHLGAGMRRPDAIVRGGAIDVEDLDNLPTPVWSIRNYSGNYFWTTNVSVPLATIRAIGGFDESFSEYGWEDIDVGLRLRARRVPAIFDPMALVYHYKPPRRTRDIKRMLAQARAQARTAVRLIALHPHWRAYLATGVNSAQRGFHWLTRRAGLGERVRSRLSALAPDAVLRGRELRLARALATEVYFEELERALVAQR